jgi:hypothetical protein
VTPDDVRALAGSAHARWAELELVHELSGWGTLTACLRHGEITWVEDGRTRTERGNPPSSFPVRPVEPYPTDYQWCAMLDPTELTAGVEISAVRSEELHGRPVVAFEARAVEGYDPICTCCPLVLSEESQRLEYGGTRPRPDVVVPEHVELALDLETGVVVSSRDVGGSRSGWFTTRLTRVELSGP